MRAHSEGKRGLASWTQRSRDYALREALLVSGLQFIWYIFGVGGKSMHRKFGALLVLSLGLVWLSHPVLAHHGNAAYDETTPVTLKGTVTEFAWANPHAQIYLDVKDDKGEIKHWSVETLSPGKLLRAGWTKDSVKAGDRVTITFYAAKNGSPVGFLLKLVFTDGKELGTREAGRS
jgi:hypothetical protein